jgi:ubiquinone/menaquinone biosynthesis C-methylase UbiE
VTPVELHAGADGLGPSLREADRVLVLGTADHAFAAATAVGMSGRVTVVGPAGPARVSAERRRRLGGHDQVALADGDAEALPAADRSIDAVVAAAPAALSRRRGRFLCEVDRVLRPGGRLVVLGENG